MVILKWCLPSPLSFLYDNNENTFFFLVRLKFCVLDYVMTNMILGLLVYAWDSLRRRAPEHIGFNR